MCAVHLDMVELERDRQGRGEPFLTIFPPHHHWITECVSVLINNAVEFSLNHCGSTNDHIVFKETALTFYCRLMCKTLILFIKNQ